MFNISSSDRSSLKTGLKTTKTLTVFRCLGRAYCASGPAEMEDKTLAFSSTDLLNERQYMPCYVQDICINF